MPQTKTSPIKKLNILKQFAEQNASIYFELKNKIPFVFFPGTERSYDLTKDRLSNDITIQESPLLQAIKTTYEANQADFAESLHGRYFNLDENDRLIQTEAPQAFRTQATIDHNRLDQESPNSPKKAITSAENKENTLALVSQLPFTSSLTTPKRSGSKKKGPDTNDLAMLHETLAESPDSSSKKSRNPNGNSTSSKKRSSTYANGVLVKSFIRSPSTPERSESEVTYSGAGGGNIGEDPSLLPGFIGPIFIPTTSNGQVFLTTVPRQLEQNYFSLLNADSSKNHTFCLVRDNTQALFAPSSHRVRKPGDEHALTFDVTESSRVEELDDEPAITFGVTESSRFMLGEVPEFNQAYASFRQRQMMYHLILPAAVIVGASLGFAGIIPAASLFIGLMASSGLAFMAYTLAVHQTLKFHNAMADNHGVKNVKMQVNYTTLALQGILLASSLYAMTMLANPILGLSILCAIMIVTPLYSIYAQSKSSQITLAGEMFNAGSFDSKSNFSATTRP